MIPLSLYVTIEFCKILQVYHIHNSIDLFDHQTNKKTECRAMNITEELGQIQHIFSDKTGTLTENRMIFRRCTINGIDYNHPPTDIENEYSKPGSLSPPLITNTKLVDDMSQLLALSSSNHINGNGHSNYHHHNQYFSPNAQRIQEFLIVLAICNTVVVSATPHRDMMNASGVIELQQNDNGSPTSKSRNTVIGTNSTTVNTTTALELTPPLSKRNKSSITAVATTTATVNSLVIANGGPSTTTSMIGDRYTRLTESRSVTPSPPPNLSFSLPKSNHIPSLSPISSSAESSPLSESPPMKVKSLSNNASPAVKAKTIITSKLNTISSFLNAKGQMRRIAHKLK